MTGKNSIQPSTDSQPSSLRERSHSIIRTAIHSPNDKGETLKRANQVLSLYFDPDPDPETRAAVRQAFAGALEAYPDWAVQRAFDQWVKTMTCRPSPGEIVILAERKTKPLTDERARRSKIDAEQREAQEARDRQRCSPQATSRILAE